MNVLITGISGFVGPYLLDLLKKEHPQWRIFGAGRTPASFEKMDARRELFTPIVCDLKDRNSVMGMLETSMPGLIFHLAGESSVFASWQGPAGMVSTNVIGRVYLFESMIKLGLKESVILCVGSSEEYGLVNPGRLPVTEENCFIPLSPYAVTKVAQDLLGFQYYKNYQLKIIRPRAFNHTGQVEVINSL